MYFSISTLNQPVPDHTYLQLHNWICPTCKEPRCSMHMRMRVCSKIEGEEGASTNLIPEKRGQKEEEKGRQKREGKKRVRWNIKEIGKKRWREGKKKKREGERERETKREGQKEQDGT